MLHNQISVRIYYVRAASAKVGVIQKAKGHNYKEKMHKEKTQSKSLSSLSLEDSLPLD